MNKQQESLAFVVMDKNEEVESNTGPVILHYSSGELEYFEPPGQSGTPQLESITEDTIDLS